jgi:hypothetical protein
MAHFAKINNGVVEQVIVAENLEWCENNLAGIWVQTSYNTIGNKHPNNKPLNKNYAGIGYTWDGIGFAAPKPYASWILNSDSYLWEAPIPMPIQGMWSWNEENEQWQSLEN